MRINHVVAACGIIVGASVLTACQATTGADDAAVAASDCFQRTPLPSPLSISPPGTDVPNEISRFSGIWSNGKWDDKLCNTLVVTSVDAIGNAKVIYSWGTYSNWDIRNADYSRGRGKITDGKLELERLENGAKVSYWFSGEKLNGKYVLEGGGPFVTLSKIQP